MSKTNEFKAITSPIALIASVLFPGIAQAQVAAAAEEADANEIVVTGSIRSAQEAAIKVKRNLPNLADVASADAVGRFPDQNSAAALSRLPAVAVQRDQGQERYIQVRGAPNRWTSVSIDGIPLTGVDEGGDSRAFRFDAIPAVLLSQLVVNKSLTADQQADAIVATVDLQTYSAMDRIGFHVTGDAGYGLMEAGGGEQRQGSLRASWSNDTFGVMLGGSHYRRKQLTDNREVGLYDALGPTEFDIRQYQIERWSNGLFGGLEVEPSDGLRLWARSCAHCRRAAPATQAGLYWRVSCYGLSSPAPLPVPCPKAGTGRSAWPRAWWVHPLAGTQAHG